MLESKNISFVRLEAIAALNSNAKEAVRAYNLNSGMSYAERSQLLLEEKIVFLENIREAMESSALSKKEIENTFFTIDSAIGFAEYVQIS